MADGGGNIERWALSSADVGRIRELRSGDELTATFQDTDDDGAFVGDIHRVVVLRNGTVTNRNWDGTVGIADDVRAMIGSEDTLYHEDEEGGVLTTEAWLDVVVSPDGSYVRALRPSELSELLERFPGAEAASSPRP